MTKCIDTVKNLHICPKILGDNVTGYNMALQ
jgi:hypothetical protein